MSDVDTGALIKLCTRVNEFAYHLGDQQGSYENVNQHRTFFVDFHCFRLALDTLSPRETTVYCFCLFRCLKLDLFRGWKIIIVFAILHFHVHVYCYCICAYGPYDLLH